MTRAERRAQQQSPSRTADSRGADIGRQVMVISAVCFALVGAFFGAGLAGGTNIRDVQDGALAADATFLAPATQAFSIWSVIYLGLIAYVIWQALPGQRASPRQRAMGWWIALTAVLNGLWLVTAQYGELWLTVATIALLLVALCLTYVQAVRSAPPRSSWLDPILIDGVTGLHLGWVTLATVANLTAWLTEVGDPSWADLASVWGVLVIAAVIVIGLGTSWAGRWRVTPPLAMAWGLAWISVGRLADEPQSAPIGIAAAVAAGVLVIVPITLRLVGANPSAERHRPN